MILQMKTLRADTCPDSEDRRLRQGQSGSWDLCVSSVESVVSLLELLCRDVVSIFQCFYCVWGNKSGELPHFLIFFFLKYVFSTLLLLPYCSRERARKIKTIKHHVKGSFVAKLIKPVSHLCMPLGGGSWFSQQHRNPCLVRADVETETSSELMHTEC